MTVVKENYDIKLPASEEDTGFKVTSWGYRHQQSLIMFFTLMVAYSMRSCMGVALVAMTHHQDGSNSNGTEFKMHGVFHTLLLTPPYPEFKWSKKVQDTVLSSFFWGYMALQIPAGQLAIKFGAKYLLFGSMLINCVVSLLLPLAAYYGGWICIVLFRIVQGFSQAFVIPSMHTFFGKWSPAEERGRLVSLAYGGGQALGTVLGLPLTGFISASPLGWPGLFRFYGALSGIMCVVLWICCEDTPAKHPKISFAERRYIEVSLGMKGEVKKPKPKSVPKMAMARSMSLWAIVVAHISQTWGQVFLYSEVPAYMDNIMGLNIKANGLLTALPFLVMCVTNFAFSWLTDMLIVRGLMTITNTRKLANSLASIPASIGFILLAFAPKNIYIVETLLVLICAFKTGTSVGFMVTHIDVSPNFAGTMMSVSNFVSNTVGCFAPLLTGFVLTDAHDPNLWKILFFTTAAIYFLSNLFFVIFGTAERASWDAPDEDQPNTDAEVLMKKVKCDT